MITGVVKSDEGRIRFTVIGRGGKRLEVEAVIDTGYTSSLTLPPEMIADLNLKWRSVDAAILADGSECLFDVYEAKLDWDGKVRGVLIDEANSDPLVGMRLLRGYEIKMQVRSKGKITIERLSK